MRFACRVEKVGDFFVVKIPSIVRSMEKIESGSVVVLELEVQKKCRFCKNRLVCIKEEYDTGVRSGSPGELARARAVSMMEGDIIPCDRYRSL